MAEPGDPVDPDRIPEVNLDFMDCPECGAIASIESMENLTSAVGNVFTWRTQCLEGHDRDNYWYHVPAGTDLGAESDVTADGS